MGEGKRSFVVFPELLEQTQKCQVQARLRPSVREADETAQLRREPSGEDCRAFTAAVDA